VVGVAALTGEPDPLPWHSLGPFFTVTVLEYTGDVPEHACPEVLEALRPRDDERARRPVTVVAEGAQFFAESVLDEVHGFVRRVEHVPSWLRADQLFVDTRHLLTLVLRRGQLVAVHTDETLAERLQRWLDRPARLPFRRVPALTLEAALLSGEAKGLWLRGTHTRRVNKPDTKSLSGRKLEDALNALEDPSFAMAAGRASLPRDPARTSLTGTVGTTPRKSMVWFKRTNGWHHFMAITAELLALLADSLAGDRPAAPVFTLLAREVDDLSEVRGAFEMSTLAPEDLPAVPDRGDDLRDAAALLQRATLTVHGAAGSAGFGVDVELDGRPAGTLEARIDGLGISFTVARTANEPAVRQVFAALAHPELVTVHYRSGHTIVDGRIWRRNTQIARFPRWRFDDFSGFDITTEKPPPSRPQDLHDAIATARDRSLFAWVVAHYREGLLTCDDGPGEIADFLHIARDETLTMIHVKAARSAVPERGVAVTAYEVVTGQAAKNLVFADQPRLVDRLRRAPVTRPATWIDGRRVADRREFIAAAARRDATALVQVVIVQPHLSATTYRRLRTRRLSDDFLRLCLLETMLNSARAAAIAVGADLEVVSSSG
jgi:hypothetical protein